MAKKVIHARLKVGDTVLFASDAVPEHYDAMESFCICLGYEKPADVERVFSARRKMEQCEYRSGRLWATLFDLLVDQFGTPRMIDCKRPAQTQ